jgi:hypothetical protein
VLKATSSSRQSKKTSYSLLVTSLLHQGGTRWRSWLRHCTTSWNVAGSIPNGVTEIFHWHNPSDRTVALGSTQSLTETSTRNISWKGGQCVSLTTFMCQLSWNLGASTSWTLRACPGLYRDYYYARCVERLKSVTLQNVTHPYLSSILRHVPKYGLVNIRRPECVNSPWSVKCFS